MDNEAIVRDTYVYQDYLGNYTLVRNSQKKAAKRNWQLCLNAAGYPCGTADGVFGSNTEKATKDFQRFYGLDQDGKAGYNTKMKMWENYNVPAICPKLTPAEIVGQD